MPFRILIFLLLLTSSIGIFGQSRSNELVVEHLDSLISMENHLDYYIDDSRSLNFEQIQQQSFSKLGTHTEQNIQSTSWFRITIHPKKLTKFLILTQEYIDISSIYVPYKNGYKEFSIGMRNVKKIKTDLFETGILNLETQKIDFDKPFYYNKNFITINANHFRNSSGFLLFTDSKKKWINQIVLDESITPFFSVYISIIFISFLLFFSSFLVLRDRNFLNYCLYLLFTGFIFIPKIPIGYNFLATINPYFGYYLTQVSAVLTSALYFYFVIYFIDVKTKFYKIYPLAIWTVRGTIIFAFVLLFFLIFIPYFPYRLGLIQAHKIIFLILSVITFIYLMFSKLSITEKIVVIGSLFLIAGQLASLIFSNIFYFLQTVVVEIVIFSTVVSFQNKLKHEEQIKNVIALNNEMKERENLIKLNQLKSKFFANISHEFRTPLTLILGPIQKMVEDKNIDQNNKSGINVIKRNANRLLELVDQLLDISKIESGNLILKVFKRPIIPFTSTLVQSFEFLAKEKVISFQISIQKTENETWFDKDALEKIILNLLSNAIKYTPKNGEIRVTAKVEGDFYYFNVQNSGKGLSKEETSKIFDRFYQKDEYKQGAGIGLSLVKELISIYKGDIKVDSSTEWTNFSVKIPIAKSFFDKNQLIDSPDIETTTPSIEAGVQEIQKTNTNIQNDENPILLIVEDNPDLRTYIKSIFEGSYSIVQAENGEIGIKMAIQHIPDIIISDIMMPVKDGIELSKTLKADQRTNHIPIILLTAKVGEDNVIEGVKTGADDYITKPFSENLLKLKVDNLLEVRRKLQARFRQEVVLKPKEIMVDSPEKQFLERLQEIIDTQIIQSDFSIETFCKSVAMSRMQLHRKLKAIFGMTTSEFIRVQRMKIAANLLKNSEISVSEIAYQVGYNDMAYFSKCFKQTYNCTPSEYATK